MDPVPPSHQSPVSHMQMQEKKGCLGQPWFHDSKPRDSAIFATSLSLHLEVEFCKQSDRL
ncbi:unnamed protein product [Prunus armeniaca]|uniref:Uncharacterized protein n=1 Tax=Prunus armeniaca TaxID=36596 RepID=A0A6J5VTS0_PRUAR|nr:unnamed protein product [Prunus armeniaca]CAB4321722.1 unnamed protein product [Prunus armeniaca]